MIVQTQPVRVYIRRPTFKRTVPKADLVATTGKFLGLFVLFTSTANWWYYKRNDRKK